MHDPVTWIGIDTSRSARSWAYRSAVFVRLIEANEAATCRFDASGCPVGAIGLMIPSSDWPADRAIHDAVRDAAPAISGEVGEDLAQPGGITLRCETLPTGFRRSSNCAT